MEILHSAGDTHRVVVIPDCTGTENNLISCFSSMYLSINCDYLLVECSNHVTQTPVVPGPIPPADLATDRLTSVTQTPVIKAPTQTDMSDTESSSEDSGVPTAVFAGVGGVVVVIIALILLVILLIVILVRKNRNRKDDGVKNGRYVRILIHSAHCFHDVYKSSCLLVHLDI